MTGPVMSGGFVPSEHSIAMPAYPTFPQTHFLSDHSPSNTTFSEHSSSASPSPPCFRPAPEFNQHQQAFPHHHLYQPSSAGSNQGLPQMVMDDDDLGEDDSFEINASTQAPDSQSGHGHGSGLRDSGTQDSKHAYPQQSNKLKTTSAERRATHNAIERARRESLNGRFLQLARVLPAMANIKRPSKSVIVNKSLEYICDSKVREYYLMRENSFLRAQVNELRIKLEQISPDSHHPGMTNTQTMVYQGSITSPTHPPQVNSLNSLTGPKPQEHPSLASHVNAVHPYEAVQPRLDNLGPLGPGTMSGPEEPPATLGNPTTGGRPQYVQPTVLTPTGEESRGSIPIAGQFHPSLPEGCANTSNAAAAVDPGDNHPPARSSAATQPSREGGSNQSSPARNPSANASLSLPGNTPSDHSLAGHGPLTYTGGREYCVHPLNLNPRSPKLNPPPNLGVIVLVNIEPDPDQLETSPSLVGSGTAQGINAIGREARNHAYDIEPQSSTFEPRVPIKSDESTEARRDNPIMGTGSCPEVKYGIVNSGPGGMNMATDASFEKQLIMMNPSIKGNLANSDQLLMDDDRFGLGTSGLGVINVYDGLMLQPSHHHQNSSGLMLGHHSNPNEQLGMNGSAWVW